MPMMNITAPFVLTRADGTKATYLAGRQEIDQEDADHWYVQAHSDNQPGDAPVPPPERGDPTEITIVKAFKLTRDDGTMVTYPVGTYEMPAQDAAHWFTRLHSDDPPPVEYPVGTPEYAAEQQRIAARKRLMEQAIEQEAHDAGVRARELGKKRGRAGKEEETPDPTPNDPA